MGSYIIEIETKHLFFKFERGCYAIVDIKDQKEYERTKAALRLMCELEKGRKSGEQQGWIAADDIRKHFNINSPLYEYSKP